MYAREVTAGVGGVAGTTDAEYRKGKKQGNDTIVCKFHWHIFLYLSTRFCNDKFPMRKSF